MKTKNWVVITVIILTMGYTTAKAVAAQDEKSLSQETEAACAASAKDKATPELVEAKVNQACQLLSKEGKAAYAKFKGKNSPFIFAGTYIWVHDMNGVMRMHPIKYKMTGKKILGMKDIEGKMFFVEMNTLVNKKGSGWVDYVWPVPGQKKRARKVSFVKKCKIDGEDHVVGCGTYDLTDKEIDALVAKSR